MHKNIIEGNWEHVKGAVKNQWGKLADNHLLNNERGKIGWILLWALGIAIPVLIVLYLLRGCT